MQTFFKAQTTNASIDSKSIIFLQKIGYSRSCVVSVYFNNRQSLEPNEIETGTVSLSLSLSDSYENFEHFLFSWSLSVLYTQCSLLSRSLHLSLINNYMNSTVGEAREREKRRGTYCEELRAPPPYFFLLSNRKKQLDVMMFVHPDLFLPHQPIID